MSEPKLTDLSQNADIPGLDMTPDADGMKEGGDALDALLKDSGADPGTGEPAAGEPAKKDEPVKKDEPAAGEPAKKDEPAAGEPAKKEEPAAPVEPAKKDEPAAPKVDDKKDELDTVELPPHMKPKTAEAFALVKERARTKIVAITKERDDLQAKVTELTSKVQESGKLAPEVEKELKELREFRHKLDVEADPEFKKFDQQVADGEEAIFAKLKALGTKDEALKKIKDIGIGEVDWDVLLAKVPGKERMFITSKLVEIENAAANKAKAIEDAKKNATEYVSKRSAEVGRTKKDDAAATLKNFDEHSAKVTWFKKIEVPANAKDEDKKAVEAHNKFIDETNADVRAILESGSPEDLSILGVGYIQMLRLQKEVEVIGKKHAAELKAKSDEIARLTETVNQKQAFIDKIKASSSTSSRSSGSGGGGTSEGGKPAPKASVDEHGGDALDRLRAENEAD